jgi:hypothetical protein
MLFVLLVWAERKHLGRVLAAAFWLAPGEARATTGTSSARIRGRAAFWWPARFFLVWWSVQSGMSLGLAVAYYAFFWIQMVTMTRVYAQVGPPILELYYLDPQKT